jgi:hypothetical protein
MSRIGRATLLCTIVGSLIAGPAIIGALVAGLASSAGGLNSAARQEAVAKLVDALRERYVYPDVGAKLADTVAANLKSGAYDKFDDPVQFTARLTADLNAIAHDKHLRVTARRSPPPVGLPPEPPHNEAGIVRADKLPGGIGYIEVIGFPPLAQFKPAVDRAMSALAGSNALIIDDRRNTGGAVESVPYLVSFLVPQGAHINDIVARTPNTTDFTRQEFRAGATPVNFAGRPMVVLTSALTISGGEEFAYDVQNLKAATVIGDVTAGGANPTRAAQLNAGMTAFIPFGRAENPVTKTNWEGKGVRPDVAVAAPEAFKVALRRLGQPAVADISAASRSQVFTPRSTPMPGSEAVARRLIGGLVSNMPDYNTMSPQVAASTRQQLPKLREGLHQLGDVQSLKFVQVDPQGGDQYDVTFAHGVRRVGVIITPDEKIQGWSWFPLPSKGSG